MFDYELLRFVWWILIGILLIGFAVTDGFDMGVGILVPFAGKSDNERRVMINSIAPHWDGNQVWLVTAGGALFAAWPMVYAAAFSGFYIAMVLVLAALFFRPIGFDFRSKIEDRRWRSLWDWGIFIGSFVPALVLGIAFGNLLQGVPLTIDIDQRVTYSGNFFQLLNPFALLAGLISFTMLLTHGACWLQMKTVGELRFRARNIAQVSTLIMMLAFILGGVWLIYGIDGYLLTSTIDHLAVSNPLKKTVEIKSGAWLINFQNYPALWTLPVLATLLPILTILCSRTDKNAAAFLFSALTITCVILTAGITMFPFVMPSSINPNVSLTMWDATSSHLTLHVMTIIVLIFVPIVLLYTIWSYVKMFGRVDTQHIEDNQHTLY